MTVKLECVVHTEVELAKLPVLGEAVSVSVDGKEIKFFVNAVKGDKVHLYRVEDDNITGGEW